MNFDSINFPITMFIIVGIIAFIIIIIIIIIILKSLFGNIADNNNSTKNLYEAEPTEVLNPYRKRKKEEQRKRQSNKDKKQSDIRRYCEFCGEKIPSDVKICPKCGATLS